MKLKDLRERLEAAEGPDRELDCAIAVDILGYRKLTTTGPEPIVNNPAQPADIGWTCPKYTASLDAAVALVGRCGFDWAYPESGWVRILDRHRTRCLGAVDPTGKTVPLALCTALVCALEETQDD